MAFSRAVFTAATADLCDNRFLLELAFGNEIASCRNIHHINSLVGTIEYFKGVTADRSEAFERKVRITYVVHDISRLSRFKNGHSENICGIPFTFRFMTFHGLLNEGSKLDAATMQTELFDELVHYHISRLPDTYSLKQRYEAMPALGY